MFSIQMWPMIVQSRLHTAGGRPVVDVPYLLRHCKYTLLCIYLLLFRSYFFIKYISHQNPKLYCRCVLLFVPLHQLTFYCVTPFLWILFFYKSPHHSVPYQFWQFQPPLLLFLRYAISPFQLSLQFYYSILLLKVQYLFLTLFIILRHREGLP